MPKCLSPCEVLETLVQGIGDQAWQKLHELYAEDTVVEHPFALPAPRRTEGREAIRKHFADFAAAPLRLEVRNMIVRQTADPEVAVAEWDYDGVVTTTAHVPGVECPGIASSRRKDRGLA